jgi:adenosylhomocysteine nucleosidase
MRRVAILGATARELAPARSVFGIGHARRGRVDKFIHYSAQCEDLEFHLIRTGIGHERARLATEAVLFALAPHAIISTGYVGGLGPEGVGALLLGSQAEDWTTERRPQAIPAHQELLSAACRAARDAGVGWSKGPIITVARVVWRAREKQALADVSGGLGVDMESAAVARVAAVGKVPFISVRAVSDKVGDDLPMDFNVWFSRAGALRGIMQVIRRPLILRGLYRMKCHADEADQTLRRFFASFVSVLQSCRLPPDSDLSVAASS